MKPAFALSLTENGITLLHRSDGDWYKIGSAHPEEPEFSDLLSALRIQAFALENDLSCTIVIPQDHVRFVTIPADDLDDQDPTGAIESELVAETSDSGTDLIYDVRTDGADHQVAAVARNTVIEAEDFAARHGFVPVRFVTAPVGDTWPSGFEFCFDPHAPALNTASSPGDLGSDGDPTRADAAPAVAEADDTPAPQPQPADTERVHPIAEPADPMTFRHPTPAAQAEGAKIKWSSPTLIALGVSVAVVLGIAVGAVSRMGSGPDTTPEVQRPELAAAPTPGPEPEPPTATVEVTDPIPETTVDPEALADAVPPDLPPEPQASTLPTAPDLLPPSQTTETATTGSDLSATDAAILEALQVAPSAVEPIDRDPGSPNVSGSDGPVLSAPEGPQPPVLDDPHDVYLSSVDTTGFTQDAIALPDAQSFETDSPVEQIGQTSAPGLRFNLDDRGLVIPTAEGALNPDGVMVFLGRPSSVPPETPVRFETDPTLVPEEDPLAQYRPRPRPDTLIETFERGQLGGRSRKELAGLRPKARPRSVQEQPQVDTAPTALAVVRVPRPRIRPSTVAALAAQRSKSGGSALGSTAAIDTSNSTETLPPRTVEPKIPSSASVARQATMDNAINLRRLNLIGVYGTPANRRALVRLPSGRYKKLKVGDRIDGGSVVAIGDSELRYQKKGRNVTLKMPRG